MPTAASCCRRCDADIAHRPQHRQRRRHGRVPLPGFRPLGRRYGRRTHLESARLAGCGPLAPGCNRSTSRGDRVAILAPQGLDYVAASSQRSRRARSRCRLFAPELQGHAERLETALRDARPTAVLTTAAAAETVRDFLTQTSLSHARCPVITRRHPRFGRRGVRSGRSRRRRRLTSAVHLGFDAAAGRRGDHPPRGRHQPAADDPVHRPAGPKHPRRQLASAVPRHGVVDDRLPGGVRRPLDADVADCLHSPAAALDPRICRTDRGNGRVVTAAPNFAYEYTAQRGLPAPEEDSSTSAMS